MRKLKGFIPTMTLLAVIMFGSTVSNAGIIIANGVDPDPCKEEISIDLKEILSVLTGIIIANKTGIIIANSVDPSKTCGIIIAN